MTIDRTLSLRFQVSFGVQVCQLASLCFGLSPIALGLGLASTGAGADLPLTPGRALDRQLQEFS